MSKRSCDRAHQRCACTHGEFSGCQGQVRFIDAINGHVKDLVEADNADVHQQRWYQCLHQAHDCLHCPALGSLHANMKHSCCEASIASSIQTNCKVVRRTAKSDMACCQALMQLQREAAHHCKSRHRDHANESAQHGMRPCEAVQSTKESWDGSNALLQMQGHVRILVSHHWAIDCRA